MKHPRPLVGNGQRGEVRSGAALVTVLCIMMLAAGVAAMLLARVGGHVRQVRSTIGMEQAFYIAEGGAERAASYLAGGGAVPATIEGTLGNGAYVTMVMIEGVGGGGGGAVGSLSGRININPNHSPDNAFYVNLSDGTRLSRDDLHADQPDYEGGATLVQLRPKGSGSQNTLLLNGSVYPIQNNTTYAFQSEGMTVRIYNDRRNPQGRAMGQWWIDFDATNAAISDSVTGQTIRQDTYFTIHSAGRIGGTRRSVTIRGLHTVSWAKYALWYDNEATTLWIVGGERFEGPVYSRPLMHFHSHLVSDLGQARFYDRVSTANDHIELYSSSVTPIFDCGLTLNAPTQTMVSVNFSNLLGEASHVFTGITHIAISSNRMYVTNDRRGWANHQIPVPNDGLVYVKTATTGSNSTRPGDLTVSASDGLAGRLTLVADRDIIVTNHVRYARNPIEDESSTDALGLIAGRHTVVDTSAPDDLDIYAHIICRDGGFGVKDYDDARRGSRGMLNVYGGIVNKTRNAVGTTTPSGYRKNYTYDRRFRKSPPPRYPAIPDEFKWLGWDG